MITDAEHFFSEYEDNSYSKLASDLCDNADDAILGSQKDYFDAGCSMFSALAVCYCCFCTFEIMSAVYTILNIIGFAVFFCKTDLICMSLLGIIGSNFWHIMAYILYSGGNRLNYDDECD